MTIKSETAPTPDTPHSLRMEKLRAHLAMVLFAGFIAASFTLGKLALVHIEPEAVNSIRFVLAAILMGIFAFGIRGEAFRFPKAAWRYVVLSGFMSLYFMTMFFALSVTTPVSTSAVYTLTPIATALVGYFLLKQITRPAMALSLLFAGVGSIIVIFRADIQALLDFKVGHGEMIYFIGCVGHAFFTVLVVKFNRGEPLSVSTFYILVGNALLITIYGAAKIIGTDWANLPMIVWVTIVYLAIFPSAISFVIVQYAAHRLPASKVMAYGYLVPIFVILFEGIAGHGWVNFAVLLGALITCLGLVILYLAPENPA